MKNYNFCAINRSTHGTPAIGQEFWLAKNILDPQLIQPTHVEFLLQATRRIHQSSRGSICINTNRLCPPILVRELHILQLNPTAWIPLAAIELHRHLRRRRPPHILVPHTTYLYPRTLRPTTSKAVNAYMNILV